MGWNGGSLLRALGGPWMWRGKKSHLASLTCLQNLRFPLTVSTGVSLACGFGRDVLSALETLVGEQRGPHHGQPRTPSHAGADTPSRLVTAPKSRLYKEAHV